MKKLYIGIDTHKESNLVALGFAGRMKPELYGNVPAEIPGFNKVLLKIMERLETGEQLPEELFMRAANKEFLSRLLLDSFVLSY